MDARARRKALRKSPTPILSQNVRSPTEIDRIVGKNITLIRNARNISQEILAAKIGVSYQQLQKYERGQNRISASRLFQLAEILKVSIQELFPDGSSRAPSFAHDYLTVENIEILSLLHELPGGERKDIAKNLLRALRI